MDQLINSANKLAHSLRSCRKSKGLTQATAAGRSGLLPKTISLLENHPEKCTVESLRKYISSLGLELILREKPELTKDRQDW